MSCGCGGQSATFGVPCGDPGSGYLPITPESVPVQLENLIYLLFGKITYRIENGRIVWNQPCDPSVPGFPRLAGEGLLCYAIRVLSVNPVTIVAAPTSPTDFSMFAGGTPPGSGFYQAADDLNLYTLKGGDTHWYTTPR